MVRVRSVEIEPNFHLRLTFTNGETRCFDMRPYLDLPVFRRLRDPAFFALAHVEYGTVVWPGAIDIAPKRSTNVLWRWYGRRHRIMPECSHAIALKVSR